MKYCTFPCETMEGAESLSKLASASYSRVCGYIRTKHDVVIRHFRHTWFVYTEGRCAKFNEHESSHTIHPHGEDLFKWCIHQLGLLPNPFDAVLSRVLDGKEFVYAFKLPVNSSLFRRVLRGNPRGLMLCTNISKLFPQRITGNNASIRNWWVGGKIRRIAVVRNLGFPPQ